MSRLIARTTPLLVIVLIVLAGEVPKSVWAVESDEGNTQIGTLYGGARTGAIGKKLKLGEFGNQRTDYAVRIQLRDMRNKTNVCNSYLYEQFEPRADISRLHPIRDELRSMDGQEILLENVRKSAAGGCVFSGFRLAAAADYSVETENRSPQEMMPPAGNRDADKVTVMGVRLCGDVVAAGEYLEAQGYENAAMYAERLRTISVSKRMGIDNYDFKVNYGGPPKRDSVYLMSFSGSFKDGPNLFESEKIQFERATGIELTCKSYRKGPKETRLECKYPAGDPDRSRPGFSYNITHEEGQNAFFVDAAAWGYPDCGP